jgi:hypothetical protein
MSHGHVEDELRSLTKAIDRLINGPVTHITMRAFCRCLSGISVETLAEQLPPYLAAYHNQGEDICDDLRESMEDARDFLEDLISAGPGRHMTNLIRQASARMRAFEEALAPIVTGEEGEDAEEGSASEDEGEVIEFAHCRQCGHILTHPRSVRRGIGPDCLDRMVWDMIWQDVALLVPDLAAQVQSGELEADEAVHEAELRHPNTDKVISDVLKRIKHDWRETWKVWFWSSTGGRVIIDPDGIERQVVEDPQGPEEPLQLVPTQP